MNGSSRPVRVAVVHDAPAVRARVLDFFKSEATTPVVLAGAELFEALAALGAQQVDVLFAQAALLAGPDAGFLRMVRERSPACRVILLTAGEPESAVLELLRAGARGFLDPLARPDLLVRCAHAVAAGEAWVPRRTVATLLDWVLRHSPATLAGTPIQA